MKRLEPGLKERDSGLAKGQQWSSKRLTGSGNHTKPTGAQFISKHNYGSKETEIEVSQELRNVIEQLEALREKNNKWLRDYEKNAELRNRREAGEGTKAELAEYHDLREAYLEHQKLYSQGIKMTRKAGLVDGVTGGGPTVRV